MSPLQPATSKNVMRLGSQCIDRRLIGRRDSQRIDRRLRTSLPVNCNASTGPSIQLIINLFINYVQGLELRLYIYMYIYIYIYLYMYIHIYRYIFIYAYRCISKTNRSQCACNLTTNSNKSNCKTNQTQ